MSAGFIEQTEVDFIVNGVGSGGLATDVASGRFAVEPRVGFDPGILRPVIQTDGKKYCVLKTGRMVKNKKGVEVPQSRHIPLMTLINNGTVPHTYNTAALPYQTWQRIDRAIIRASRNRLNAWKDIAAANTYGGFDGMAVTALIRDTMTDPGDAKVDMHTLSDDVNDAGQFTPDILPLPIIHAGATISQRQLAQSRNGGVPLDTTLIEACGRRCAETLEKMTIGITSFTGLKIGQSQQVASTDVFANQGIYGFLTHPDNIDDATITAPGSFVPATLLADVLGMIELMRAQNLFGPFVLYYGTAWDQYMSQDYYVTATAAGIAAPHQTMLQRLQQIGSISRIAMLDNLTGTNYNDRLILVQMTSETVRAVNGMEFTTVQWSKDGGAQLMLRVMGIKVPDLRSQYVAQSVTAADRICAIVDGNPA